MNTDENRNYTVILNTCRERGGMTHDNVGLFQTFLISNHIVSDDEDMDALYESNCHGHISWHFMIFNWDLLEKKNHHINALQSICLSGIIYCF